MSNRDNTIKHQKKLNCVIYYLNKERKTQNKMNTKLTFSDMNAACTAGDLNQIKYLHENDCMWNEDACVIAAKGHLDCLKYLHENKCPWVY
ncbi:MAG: hypothetical protein KAS12_02850 [Candidatus Aenigmarchaeota archaeon]|nr:hypothetical protein [Candidatus Aenigmarchaeota archaeon]